MMMLTMTSMAYSVCLTIGIDQWRAHLMGRPRRRLQHRQHGTSTKIRLDHARYIRHAAFHCLLSYFRTSQTDSAGTSLFVRRPVVNLSLCYCRQFATGRVCKLDEKWKQRDKETSLGARCFIFSSFYWLPAARLKDHCAAVYHDGSSLGKSSTLPAVDATTMMSISGRQ